MSSGRHPCPACDHLTLGSASPSGETCPVCGWTDDVQPGADPADAGSNRIKLARARVNFACLSVSDPRRRSDVRRAQPEERPPG